ncbi:hypothetical protein HA402_012489 [Bradysia odoriphaga]|nr:hypothetical protein HA402_012489 [Bradysia odoriphaga]
MKGSLIKPGVSAPHLNPIKSSANQPWKPFPDKQVDIRIPVRPGQATECDKKICLRVNHFPMNIKLPAKIYHYVVDVTKIIDDTKPKKSAKDAKKPLKSKDEPENQMAEKKVLPRHLRYTIHRKLLDQLREAFSETNPGKKIGIISDRSTALYSTQMLELSVPLEQNVEIHPDAGENGRHEVFRVTLAPTVEKINTNGLQGLINNMKNIPITSDLDALDRIYNTLMKNLNCSRYVPIGRSSLICFDDNTSFALGGGLLNFKGYDATIEITNGWKPFLNVHIANCATLLNKNVIEVFADLFNLSQNACRTTDGWTGKDFKLASDLLSSCKVKYFPSAADRTKILGGTVTKVIPMSISKKKFSLEEPNGRKREISIYDYFVEKYGRTDLDPNGPCLELNSKNYVPAEICEVKKGQSINRKLTSDQTTKMLNCSKKPPNMLQTEIEGAIRNLNVHNDPILKEFGCSFENRVSLLELSETRKLADPLLCYNSQSNEPANIIPANGVWDSYRCEAKFLDPRKISKWGILYTCKGYNRSDLTYSQSDFVTKLKSMGNVAGVQFTSEPISYDLSREIRDQEEGAAQNIKILTNCFQNEFKDCQIVLVSDSRPNCVMFMAM